MDTIINNCKIIWVSFILFLMACPVIGQVKKTRQLTSEDYHLWSTLRSESISDYGKWVSYSLSYESGLDTLFVKNTVTAKTVAFAKGHEGKFVGDSWFACLLPENRFQFLNLNNGKIQDIENVQNYAFSKEDNYVILYHNGIDGKTNIVIRNLKGDLIEEVDNVTSFTMNTKGDALAYCIAEQTGNSVGLLQFRKKITKIIVTQNGTKLFENVVWNSDGKSIAFVSRAITTELFIADTVLYYVIADNKLFQYDTTTDANWPIDKILDSNYTSTLGISNDGERVFFMMKKKHKSGFQYSNEIQIWNAADKDLFPIRNSYGNSESESKLASWSPKTGKIRIVGDSLQPSAVLNGNQQYALVYNSDDNKPSWKQEADRDYFLMDLNTGNKTLFLKQQLGTIGNLFLSPGGKYIAYFRDCDWWIYSISSNVHTNITEKTGIAFYDDSKDMPEEPQPYGNLGWSPNDNSLLLYDQFDIWEVKLDGGVTKRLTHGRESQQIFRVVANDNGYSDGLVTKGNVFDLKQGLLLKAHTVDNRSSGYFMLDKRQNLRPIIFAEKLISGMHKAKESNHLMYLQQDFNESPSLVVKNGTGQSKVIFKSNPQQKSYNWGTSKLIDYKNSKGIALKGVLVYPFDYDTKRQYPMIVYIYEKQTSRLHSYTNPSLLNGTDFNPALFSSKDYFVLFPDINYEIGNPGLSATDCVLAATAKVLETEPIDKKRIGLMGHSFGGYETDFIITQTNIFAAAIAGAGVTDFTSCYLSVAWSDKKPNGWHFEYQQMRMGKSLFEDYEGYQRNSPINAVANVSTPLFSYAGADDTQVNPYQTMEFYLALRRLKKEHIMILYPQENHIIQKKENQIDLTNRIMEWFGYYLKEEKKPEWFESQ
ncbi:S9 family peptidase [Flavobacterium sp. XS2P14]|uniref:S9 family peptidase n=1 Tax=Flavobacterium sp. XS2P14 TaxID=3401735 RepID=UPI003AAB86F1